MFDKKIMKKKWVKYFISFIIVSILFGILIQSIELLIIKKDLSPEGGPDPFFATLLITVPLVFIACLSFPVGIIALAIKKTRVLGIFILCGALVFLGAMFAMSTYNSNVRMEAFEKLGSRLTPLINAIEKYKIDKGNYPANLQDLVPEYLPKLPATRMKNYSNYEYNVEKQGGVRGGDPWRIVIDAGYGMGFDKFVYYPNQKEWIYIHD